MNALVLEILAGLQNFLSVMGILLFLRFCYAVGENRKWRSFVIAGLGFVFYAILMGVVVQYITPNLADVLPEISIIIYLGIVSVLLAETKKWLAPLKLIPSMLLYYMWSNLFELIVCIATLNRFNYAFTDSFWFSLLEDTVLVILLMFFIPKKEKNYSGISLNLLESVLVSVFCFFSMIFTAVFEYLDEVLLNGLFTLVWMLFMIILNIIIPYAIIHRCRTRYYRNLSENYKEQFEMEYYFFKNYKEQQKEESKSRHDFKNHMLLLQSMFEKGEYEKAKEYFAKLTDKKKENGNYFLTGNEIVDMILNAKQEKIEKNEMQVTCEGGLESLAFMDSMDVCVLFSNLIDNAIEANSKCDAERFLSIRSTTSAGAVMLLIQNNTNGDVQLENGKLVTTKKDKKNHGFGTANAFEIIKKYNGEYTISTEENVFSIKILFPMHTNA